MPSPSVTLLRTQTDDRLVALAAGGHERAFEAIVERHRRSLLRHARRYLPEARAEDALQQALLSAWTALRRGDDVRDLRPWLHRIVQNTSLNALRAAGYDYDELRETLEGTGGPAELAERRSVVRGTLAGLAALPDRQRDALLQIAVEGRSQDEVAAELGLSQNAVRQLVHRARTSLRAAATAVLPLPVATWLATAGADRGDFPLRVGELVAGAGGSATLAKAGAVAVIAGGAVAGPAVVHDVSGREPSRAAAAGPRPDAGVGGRDKPVPTAAPAPAPSGAGGGNVALGGAGGGDGERRDPVNGSSGSGHDKSGSGRNDDDEKPSSHPQGEDDTSGSGRRDDESDSAGDDSSSDSYRSGDESSRSRGGEDDEAEHRDDAPSQSSGDDDPPAGSGGDEGGEDEGSDSSPSGSGRSGTSSERGDDEDHVPAAAPSATPQAAAPEGGGGSPDSGEGD